MLEALPVLFLRATKNPDQRPPMSSSTYRLALYWWLESMVRVHGCDIQRGKWRSAYDGVVTRRSTTFDIDHLPLAEAWDSGANRWTAATRQAYANHLATSRTLRFQSASACAGALPLAGGYGEANRAGTTARDFSTGELIL